MALLVGLLAQRPLGVLALGGAQQRAVARVHLGLRGVALRDHLAQVLLQPTELGLQGR